MEESDDEEAPKKRKKPAAKPSKKNKKQPPTKKPKRGVRVEIEYEDENEGYMERDGATAAGAGMAW